jgi:hypothetical protein
MTRVGPMAKAIAECARWGVPVEQAEERPSGRCLTGGPTGGAIDWENPLVWVGDLPDDPMGAAAAVHELHHVVAHAPPNRIREVTSEIVALDHEAMVRLRLPWAKWMAPAQTGFGDWGRLGEARRQLLLEASYQQAFARGLMTADGKPTYRFRRDGTRLPM